MLCCVCLPCCAPAAICTCVCCACVLCLCQHRRARSKRCPCVCRCVLPVTLCLQGINQPAPKDGPDNAGLQWLWQQVDVLCPSIYPSSDNATAEAARAQAAIQGAIDAAALVKGKAPPAVMPYARALLIKNNTDPFTQGILAAQVQLAAGMGVAGVILWGASEDYHGNGCRTVAAELTSFAGATMQKCIANRAACATVHCSGNGRCVDYFPKTLLQTCLVPRGTTCRCDYGHSGADCSSTSSSRTTLKADDFSADRKGTGDQDGAPEAPLKLVKLVLFSRHGIRAPCTPTPSYSLL